MTYSALKINARSYIEDEDGIDATGASGVYNTTTFTDHDDSLVNGALKFSFSASGGTGTYTYSVPSSITVGGKTFSIINNGNGTFSLLNSQFQYLNANQAIKLSIPVTVSDGCNTACGNINVTIVGTNDNTAPVVQWVHYYDDEDGNEAVLSNDTIIGNRLVFNFVGTDADGDALTYNIQTGTYTHPSAVGSYTVTATTTAGVYTVAYNGHTYTVKNLGNGTFEYLTSGFQYLNPGQNVFLALKYTATDSKGATSAYNWAKVTISGTADNNIPCVQDVCYSDDEDGLNTVTPNDTQIPGRLVFGFNGTDADGDTLTYSIKTGTFTSGGQTYTVASTSTAGTYTVTNNGQTFTVKDLGNGKFEYLTSEFQYLNNGQTRTLVIQYTANDGNGGTSNTANATVVIYGTNDNRNPSVSWVHYYDDEDGDETFTPNDTEVANKLVFSFVGSDPDGDTITYHLVTGTYTHPSATGSFTVAATATPGVYTITNDGKTFTVKDLGNGKFEYLTSEFQYLNPGESKFLALQYYATDGNGGTSGINWAKVTIYGRDDNHNPCTINVSYSDDEDGLNTVNPSDTLVNTKLVFGFQGTDSDGDTLTYSIKTGTFTSGGQTYTVASTATAGTYTVTNNGQTFTVKDLGNGNFEYLTSEFQYLNPGQTRTLVIQYTANDGHGGTSNVSTATVTIYGTNAGPDAVNDYASVNYGSSVNIPVLANDTDPDSDDLDVSSINSMTINGVTIPQAQWSQYFTINNETGQMAFNSSNMSVPAGTTSNVVINYTATDGIATDSANVYITVCGPNLSLVASNQQFVDDEDAIDGTGATAGAFTDQDSGIPGALQFTINNFTYNGSGAVTISGVPATLVGSDGNTYTVTNNGNGTFTLNKAQFQGLDTGEKVEFTFNYTASAGGLTSTAQAKVVIIGTNDAPCVANVVYQDDEDALTTVAPSDTEIPGRLVFGFSGTDVDVEALTYSIKTGTFTSGGQTYTVASTSTAGTYTVTNNGQTFTIKNLGNGKFEYLTSEFQYLNAGQTRTLVFQYQANDGTANSNTSTATVTIYGTDDNGAPCAFNVSYQDDEDALTAVTPNDTQIPGRLVFGFNASDPDGNALTYIVKTGTYTVGGQTYTVASTGTAGTYTVTNNGQTFTVKNLGNGKFEYLTSEFQYLDAGQTRTLVFQYLVNDGTVNSNVANATVTIYGTNDVLASNQTFVDDEDAIDGTGATAGGFTDLDSGIPGTLQFTINNYTYDGSGTPVISGIPTSVTVDGITYTITNNGNGSFSLNKAQFQHLAVGEKVEFTFNYTVSDGAVSSTAVAKVVVIGTNDGIDAIDDNVGTIQDGASVTVPVLANDIDPEGEDLDVSSINSLVINGVTIPQAQWAQYFTVNNETGQLVFNSANMNVPAGTSQNVVINYTAVDPYGATDSANVLITVQGDALCLVASNQKFVDDEDAVDGTGASAVVAGVTETDQDSGIPSTLRFAINNYTYNGSSAVTFSGIPASVVGSDGVTYAITNLGNGNFSVNKAAFQSLAVGEAVTLTFNYTVTAGSLSSTAQAKVIIIGTNDGIDAVDDNVGTINDGASVSFNVLTNDIDPEGEDLDVSSINSLVINGVTIPQAQWSQYLTFNNETGQWSFNSANMNVPAGTSQNVVINYTAIDPHGATDSANVFLTVRGDNLCLVASNQQFVDDEDAIDATGATSGVYTDQDAGIPGALQFTINNYTYNGSSPVTITGVPTTIVGSDGNTYTVTNNGNGTFTLNKAQFQGLDTGERVELTFNYTATAGSLTSSAQAKVVIIGTNDAPCVANVVYQDDEDALTAVSPNDTQIPGRLVFGFNGSDVDGEALTYTIKTGTFTSGGQSYTVAATATTNVYTVTNNGQTFTIKNLGNGTFEYLTSEFQYLNSGETRTLVIQYQANDGTVNSNTSTATVTIYGTDDVIASNQNFIDDEDAIDGTGATAAGYTDHDDGIPGTLRLTINNFVYNGTGTPVVSGIPSSVTVDGHTYTITNNGNGTFTLDKSQFQHLSVGEKVEFTFNYTVSDGVSSDTAQAHVVIIGTNDGIDAVDDNAGTINDGASVSLNILANDTDTDGDDLDVSSINSLVINGVTIPQAQWAQYFTVNSETGQLVFNSANMDVPAGTSQNVVINYTATDPYGATDSANVFLTVRGPDLFLDATNQEFVDDEDAVDATGATAGGFTDEDDGIPGTLEFQISSPSYNGSQTITYSGIPASVVGSDGVTYAITNLGNGRFSVNKAAFQHLAVGELVTLTFTYGVSASGLSDTAQAKVVIIGTNDGPDAVNDNVGTVLEGSTFTVPVLNNDSDPDGDPITVTGINSITIDGVVITDPALIAQYVTILPNGQLYVDTSSIDKNTDYDIVINYEISDPYGLTDSANVYINVDNVDKVIYYGDNENYTLNLITNPANASDTVIVTSGSISNTVKNFIDNVVVKDDADAYGDVKNFTLNVKAGNATAYASPAVEGGTEYALAITDAVIENNTFNFGDDNVTVNRGLIVGDVDNLVISGQQGNASANFDINCFDPFAKASANVDVRNNILNFGDDVLKIGKGDIYGDVNKITLSYTNGSATGNGQLNDDDNWIGGNVFNFGDDTITAREGALTGDLGSIVVNGATYSTPAQIQAYLASAANTNTFNFGNDTFVVTLAEPFDIKITDFGIGGVHDKLKITGASNFNGVGGIDVNDLTAVSQVVNEAGHIKLVIDTNNDGTAEGTVEFLNISFSAGQVEITDYLSNTDIIITA